jgi:ankyrin repeat protein
MMASMFNHGDCIEYLLKSGANIERKDVDSLTPLLLAAMEGNEQVNKNSFSTVGSDITFSSGSFPNLPEGG